MAGGWIIGVLAVLGSAGGSSDEVEATSLLGSPLTRPKLAEATRKRYEDQLSAAQTAYAADPGNVDKAIWVGRRLAYLGRFRESIKFYTLALQRFPNEPKLLRHRGHRYLTVRDLKAAAADFETAVLHMKGKPDEIEPDGQPNARNIPIGSLHSNVWYHLGLAYYLQGEWSKASQAYAECQKTSSNDDRLVSTSYWQALAFARSGDRAATARVLERIRPEMQVIENDSYHQLLLYFKGEVSESKLLKAADEGNAKATIGYGIAAWKLAQGDASASRRLLEEIVAGPNWTAFGYLAAEADLARLPR